MFPFTASTTPMGILGRHGSLPRSGIFAFSPDRSHQYPSAASPASVDWPPCAGDTEDRCTVLALLQVGSTAALPDSKFSPLEANAQLPFAIAIDSSDSSKIRAGHCTG